MLKIGITGGIGSGKTTICKIFESLNVPVFNADIVAKDVMKTNVSLINSIKETFGDDSYFDNGDLNTKYIGSQVFNNQQALNKINSIVHPVTIQAFADWAKDRRETYIIKEAALLFESGSYKDCDFNIVVLSPEHLRLKRVMRRDRVDEESVRARMSKQMPEAEKEKLADFVIINDEREALIPQVLKLHKHFIQISHSSN